MSSFAPQPGHHYFLKLRILAHLELKTRSGLVSYNDIDGLGLFGFLTGGLFVRCFGRGFRCQSFGRSFFRLRLFRRSIEFAVGLWSLAIVRHI